MTNKFKLTWVNHASFMIEGTGVSLMTDPWLEGDVFNNGWRLHSKTKFQYEEFSMVNFIWFSHEHPDHFSPPNLKKIPKDLRERITVLYQETRDKKVLKFCKFLGFRMFNLKNETWQGLGDNFEVMCGKIGQGDSWLAIKIDEKVLLNLNDCPLNNKARINYIKKCINAPIKILFSQFSPGGWTGNKDQLDQQKMGSQNKINALILQTKILSPEYIIPFASYFYFCHEDNFYLNKTKNDISYVEKIISKKTDSTPLVFYPGETWQENDPWDNSQGIKFYQEDLKRVLDSKDLNKSQRVSLEELELSFKTFLKILYENNNKLMIRILPKIKIFLKDYDVPILLSSSGEFKTISKKKSNCDIVISSDNLKYAFENLWGGDSLLANGLFQKTKSGTYKNFRIYVFVAFLNNMNKSYPLDKIKGTSKN